MSITTTVNTGRRLILFISLRSWCGLRPSVKGAEVRVTVPVNLKRMYEAFWGNTDAEALIPRNCRQRL